MSTQDCIFCKIIAGQIPCNKIYEDESVLVFLDIGPVSDGHVLLVPKEHFEKLDQCSDQIVAGVSGCLGKIAKAVVSAMDADGYNVLCNNGRAAGQLVDHVHFHIIPRNADDGVFNRWNSYKYAAGRAEEITAEICKKL